MRRDPAFTAWKITCASSDEAKALAQWLSSRIDLDRTMTDTARTVPNGVEHVETIPHRLGDYFAAIHVLPDLGANARCFQLRFERRTNAGRFWRDLMVNILQEIEATPERPSVVFQSKAEPDAALSGS